MKRQIEQSIVDKVYRSGDVSALREFVTPAAEPVWDELIAVLSDWRQDRHRVEFEVVEVPLEIECRCDTGTYASGYYDIARMVPGWGLFSHLAIDGWGGGEDGRGTSRTVVRITGTPALRVTQYAAGFTRDYPPTEYLLMIFCTPEQVTEVLRCMKAAGVGRDGNRPRVCDDSN